MKRSFFQAAVVSILLYGCTTWTLERKLDGNHTRMLRALLNKSWRQQPTRHQLYGHLPPMAWTAINRLLIIWKSDLTNKMKRGILLYGCTTWKLTKQLEEARRQLHKNATSNIEQVLAATPHKAPTIWPPASLHENYPS